MSGCREQHKCPPHHFVVDPEGVGHCKYCPEVKHFGEAKRKRVERAQEKSRAGGRKGRRGKSR